MLSAHDAWAVGNYFDTGLQAEQTLIQHWDGTTWSIASSPNMGSADNLLFGVSALTSEDVWAVGSWTAPQNYSKTLILHWNGVEWSVVPSPTPGPVGYGFLFDVTAIAADDVWAVGDAEISIGITHTLVEHWNGSTWRAVRSPNRGELPNALGAVAAIGPDDAWAVGSWFGPGDVYRTLVLRWDGTDWSVVPSANVKGGAEDNTLSGVAVVGGSKVWAVGAHGSQTLAERWNGSAWRVVPSPTPGIHQNGGLADVAVVAGSEVWAVGSYVSDTPRLATLIERWDGTSWTVEPSPNAGTSDNELLAVAARKHLQFAVGNHFAPRQSGAPQRTLILGRRS